MDKLLEEFMVKNKLIMCPKCDGRVFYRGKGRYICPRCEEVYTDLYGKILEFVKKNPQASIDEIGKEMEVKPLYVDLIMENEDDIPSNSKYLQVCQKCGCSWLDGRYCVYCSKELYGNIKQAMMETPKKEYETDVKSFGKMRFAGWKRR